MAVCASLCAALLCSVAPAAAQSEEEMDILQMIYKDKDLVTPSRTPKPISQVAENITVITAEEIEAINAHTLADVLYHVTGVQVDVRGGPGSAMNVLIQGSDPRHVQVMVDGVSLNSLADNVADLGAFPVQQIERIEIIKGPASSAWGSALGGIINIITRSPDPDRKLGGTVSAGGGDKGTGDFRADASGTVGSLGYYLYGGGLTSDGLTPSTAFDGGHLYTKLMWEATRQAKVQFSLGYDKGGRGDGQFLQPGPGLLALGEDFERFFTTLALNYTLSDTLNLDLSGRVAKKRVSQFVRQLSSGAELQRISTDDLNFGGSAKLAWRSGMHNALAGFDYDHGRLESLAIKDGRQDLEKWALFANDTLAVGAVSVTPGVRYDHTSTNGDFVSPSLGITWAPFAQTILRGYVAQGFNTPPLSFTFGDGFFFLANPALKAEKVLSYSIGLETALFKYAWLKTTGFLHDIRDVIAFVPLPGGAFTAVNSGKQRRQGVEVEVKTLPVFNTSLLAGYAFIDATDRQTGRRIPNIPRTTCDLGLDYNDNESLRGALRGHYIWWNADAALAGRYRAFIWDLNLSKKVVERDATTVELFFTAHNLFNGAQYLDGTFRNPGRWFEGGARVKF
jgi:vitamin B12 transporter